MNAKRYPRNWVLPQATLQSKVCYNMVNNVSAKAWGITPANAHSTYWKCEEPWKEEEARPIETATTEL
jgi:hypothetical protein